MTVFYLQVAITNSQRTMTGVTTDKTHAEKIWGVGNYIKVTATDESEAQAYALKNKFFDVVAIEKTIACKAHASCTATTIRHIEKSLGIDKPKNAKPRDWMIAMLAFLQKKQFFDACVDCRFVIEKRRNSYRLATGKDITHEQLA